MSSLLYLLAALDRSPSFSKLWKFCMRPAAPPVLKSRSSLVNSFVKLLIEAIGAAIELLGALTHQMRKKYI